jgi:hypothetical protein
MGSEMGLKMGVREGGGLVVNAEGDELTDDQGSMGLSEPFLGPVNGVWVSRVA